MRLVFAGTPEPAAVALRALLASDHDVLAVITRPDAPSGRGRKLTPCPVAQLATDTGIELLQPSTTKDPHFLNRLREIAPDCCPIVAYGGLIPAAALDIPPHGWVNLHFSLLPAWRGAAPVQHALMAGDDLTGATTFQLETGLDTGPSYGVMTEKIQAEDTTGTLLTRLAEGGAQLLIATLDGIATGELTPIRQSPVGISLAPKLTPAMAQVRWDTPATTIDRHIRACTPAPGAWTTHQGQRLKLAPITISEHPEPLPPGELHVTKKDLIIGTGSTPVRLNLVAPPGKSWMPAADWARGARLTSGTILGQEDPR